MDTENIRTVKQNAVTAVREKCTAGKSLEKRVLRHIWSGWVEKAEEARYIPKYKDLYNKRKETIERIFADAKERYWYAGIRSIEA